MLLLLAEASPIVHTALTSAQAGDRRHREPACLAASTVGLNQLRILIRTLTQTRTWTQPTTPSRTKPTRPHPQPNPLPNTNHTHTLTLSPTPHSVDSHSLFPATLLQEAIAARDQTHGYKLDRSHTFAVTLFDDFERYAKVPDEYQEPEAKPYQPTVRFCLPHAPHTCSGSKERWT